MVLGGGLLVGFVFLLMNCLLVAGLIVGGFCAGMLFGGDWLCCGLWVIGFPVASGVTFEFLVVVFGGV